MFQALLKRGRVLPIEVPKPKVSPGSVLIKVVNSCISSGTEISSVRGSSKGLIRRALDQPGNVKKAFGMLKKDGIANTLSNIKDKLDMPIPRGYSIAGMALAIGDGVRDIQPGDKVAAAGGGYALHAEFVDVPKNLVMPMPDRLDYPSASTVALGGIAMQAVRRANVKIGEFTVVYGTGIIGLLAVQMLKLSGARVIAIDLDKNRLQIALDFGVEAVFCPSDPDYIRSIMHYTGGKGTDITVFCASTDNPQALSDAFAICRKKGRVVMVGKWGKELNRGDIYSKEIDFLISTSYGPGRYDSDYEERGIDYPYAYIRWSEKRNMEEYLRLLNNHDIKLKPLINAVYDISQVEEAFDSLNKSDPPILALLDYGENLSDEISSLQDSKRAIVPTSKTKSIPSQKINVGIIGAGSFALGMHLPNLQKLENDYKIRAICNRTGSKAQYIAQKYLANYATSDYQEIIADPEIDLVMICTRHNLHGKMVLDSLKAGKHTFVEKPLCTRIEELEAIRRFFNTHHQKPNSNLPVLMVGFNRRFSKYAQEIKKHVQHRINPLFIHYRMNAGYIPLDHWVHTEEGAGRIIGEACHIIDIFSYLIDNPIRSYADASLRPNSRSISSDDNKSIILEYEDGSVATLDYFAVGSKRLPKEQLEVHFDEKSIIVEDYRSMHGFGLNLNAVKSSNPEKGQYEELEFLAKHLKNLNSKWPITLHSLLETTEVTLKI